MRYNSKKLTFDDTEITGSFDIEMSRVLEVLAETFSEVEILQELDIDLQELQLWLEETMADTEYKLKTCPFCSRGAPVVRISDCSGVDYDGKQYQVICDFLKDGCGSSGGVQDSMFGAVRLWNTAVR